MSNHQEQDWPMPVDQCVEAMQEQLDGQAYPERLAALKEEYHRLRTVTAHTIDELELVHDSAGNIDIDASLQTLPKDFSATLLRSTVVEKALSAEHRKTDDRFRGSISVGTNPRIRDRVYIEVAGVKYHRRAIGIQNDYYAPLPGTIRNIEAGKVLTGQLTLIDPKTEYGGRLILRRSFGRLIDLTGIVDQQAQPRVRVTRFVADR